MGSSSTVKVCYGLVLPTELESVVDDFETILEDFKGVELELYGHYDYSNWLLAIKETCKREDWGAITIGAVTDNPEYDKLLLAAYKAIKDHVIEEHGDLDGEGEAFKDHVASPGWIAAAFYG